MRTKIINFNIRAFCGKEPFLFASGSSSDILPFRGKISVFHLEKDIYIDGIKFPVGCAVGFDKDNNPELIITRGSIDFGGNDIPPLTYVRIQDHKVVCAKFIVPVELDGKIFSPKSVVYFHPNKHVASGTLLHSYIDEVSGIMLSKGNHYNFFDDGSVALGVLGEDRVLNGVLLKKGTHFEYKNPGELRYVMSESDVEIEGINYAENYHIFFYPNGNLWIATLAEDTVINGIKFPAETELEFDKSGQLKEARVSALEFIHKGKNKAICNGGIVIDGVKIISDPVMDSWNKLPYDMELKGFVFPKGSLMDFYKGKLEWISPSRDIVSIRGRKIGQNEVAYFTKTGQLSTR